jgi:glycosyltransferase involved in cell wall biosynthesis
MRVLIDALQKPGHPRGIGRYVEGLAAALAQIPDLAVVVAVGRWHESWYQGLPAAGVRVIGVDVPTNVGARHAWHVFGLPRLARRVSADVVHVAEVVPAFGIRGWPVVATIHDAAEAENPATFGRIQLPYRRWLIRTLLTTADEIIAPSAHTAARLAPARPPNQNGISPIHHGPGLPSSVSGLEPAKSIAEPFFLYVGALQRHKNVPRLIRAFRAVAKGAEPNKPTLVLAGGYHNDAAAVNDAISRDPRITHLGQPTDEELAWLYDHAAALVFPSLGEGFGFPIVEAMRRGCPVITSAGGAAAEIADDAALLVDPLDEASLSAAMTKVLTNGHARAELIELGQRRSEEFTWTSSAAATAQVYRRAFESKIKSG